VLIALYIKMPLSIGMFVCVKNENGKQSQVQLSSLSSIIENRSSQRWTTVTRGERAGWLDGEKVRESS